MNDGPKSGADGDVREDVEGCEAIAVDRWCELFEHEGVGETRQVRTLRLREGETRELALDTDSLQQARTVRDLFREWFAGAAKGSSDEEEGLNLVRTSVRVNEDEEVSITVRVSASRVGFGSASGPLASLLRSRQGGGETKETSTDWLVVVEPKLEEVATGPLIAMAAAESGLGEMLEVDADAHVQLGQRNRLLPALLEMYRSSLEVFFARGRGLRRLHRTRNQTFAARRRGKLRVGRYLRNISRGDLLEVPCRHPSHELDNLPNRTLLTALDVLLRAGSRCDACRENDCVDGLRRFRRRFDGVSDELVQPPELRDLDRLPESFGHYVSPPDADVSGPLPLASWIIRNLRFEQRAGSARLPGVSVKMWRVFELAFTHLMRGVFGSDRVKVQGRHNDWSYRLVPAFDERAKTIDKGYQPDIYVEPRDGQPPMIFDTKWKAARCVDSGKDSENKERDSVKVRSSSIRNSDINQIAAYAHITAKREVAQPIAVLVYPDVTRSSEETTFPSGVHHVVWGAESSGGSFRENISDPGSRLAIAFWPVQTHPSQAPKEHAITSHFNPRSRDE